MNVLEEATNIATSMIMKGHACSEPTLHEDGTASFLVATLVRKGKKLVEERMTIIVKPA